MRNKYYSPYVEFVAFSQEDVLAASGNELGSGGTFDTTGEYDGDFLG